MKAIKNMKRILFGFDIGFCCVMAGLAFGDGRVGDGIFDLIIAAIYLLLLFRD